MTVSNVTNSAGATSRGTPIIQQGSNTLDQNAFLKILSAELSNQDPTSPSDPTQSVTQMAQFTSLEQMTNLNTTTTMASANALIGKAVTLNQTDEYGNQYAGIVSSVSNIGGNIKLNVDVTQNGTTTTQQFDYSDVADVYNMPDSTLTSVNENMLLLTASSLIGKNAEFSKKDANGNDYVGTVKGVSIDSNNNLNITVQPDGSTSTVDIPYNNLIKVNEA